MRNDRLAMVAALGIMELAILGLTIRSVSGSAVPAGRAAGIELRVDRVAEAVDNDDDNADDDAPALVRIGTGTGRLQVTSGAGSITVFSGGVVLSHE